MKNAYFRDPGGISYPSAKFFALWYDKFMGAEKNLIVKSGQNEKNRDLKMELEAALEVIKNYEKTIAELKLENSSNLKYFTHELSNPLQILSMTIESLQDNPPKDLTAALERMKKSADKMTAIIVEVRKLKKGTGNLVNHLKAV